MRPQLCVRHNICSQSKKPQVGGRINRSWATPRSSGMLNDKNTDTRKGKHLDAGRNANQKKDYVNTFGWFIY